MASFLAVAIDFDGTLAHDGIVDEPTIGALRRLRHADYKLILVTGRELSSLLNTFAHIDVFDRVVLENGGLLLNPADKTTRVLASAPPPALIAELDRLKVPVSVGHSIIATVEPYEQPLLAAIKRLGVEWQVIFNKGSVMALPSGVNKATGLLVALTEVEVPAGHTIGIGDAENDHALLDACGFGVAVANALPSLKAGADLVTNNPRGAGVIEVVDKLLANALPGRSPDGNAAPPPGAPTPDLKVGRP